ncbi:hypothetical protein CDAR_473341 [Caerostris darwini]|uniref:Reverse transcriptase n=1 Tax=Caerostris darwini TaxID=1538125 RepID=A0AAV4TVX8_9ARAC|nr:hypothetical protein CDAR_473341 [Caerostris darwini]
MRPRMVMGLSAATHAGALITATIATEKAFSFCESAERFVWGTAYAKEFRIRRIKNKRLDIQTDNSKWKCLLFEKKNRGLWKQISNSQFRPEAIFPHPNALLRSFPQKMAWNSLLQDLRDVFKQIIRNGNACVWKRRIVVFGSKYRIRNTDLMQYVPPPNAVLRSFPQNMAWNSLLQDLRDVFKKFLWQQDLAGKSSDEFSPGEITAGPTRYGLEDFAQ